MSDTNPQRSMAYHSGGRALAPRSLLAALAVALPLLTGCSEAPESTNPSTAPSPVTSAPAAATPANQAEFTYSEDWGPALGSTLPILNAEDHTGTRRTLADLSGEEGLLLIVSRSADW